MSGGIDSTVCASFYLRQGFPVEALYLDYGQPSSIRERLAVSEVAGHLGIPLRIAQVTAPPSFQQAEILGRNGFLALYALMTCRFRSGIIALGIHSGTQYFDCSSPFMMTMQSLFDGYTDGRFCVSAPFLKWSKIQIWEFGVKLGAPLSSTYSCELGLNQPCTKCRSCSDREAIYAGQVNNYRP